MNYRDFFSDFGSRCFEVVGNPTENGADGKSDRSVTAMLVVLAASLTIPYERLKPVKPPANAGTNSRHPSGDALRHLGAASKYASLLDTEMTAWLGGNVLAGWRSGNVEIKWADENSWPSDLGHLEPFDGSKTKVSDVLDLIRNALAHGNIWAESSPITHVAFLSINSKRKTVPAEGYPKDKHVDFKCLQIPADSMGLFVLKWAAFLQELSGSPSQGNSKGADTAWPPNS